jgi:1-acyl-sn-glycerol-3-phosphate acyltransferase
MSHAFYFKVLKIYADPWSRRHCRVILSGEEHLASLRGRNRIYLVSHPTTWDLVLLAHISREHFCVVVAEGPFTHPLVNWLFTNAGFLKLGANNSEEVIAEACRRIESKVPLVYSLKGWGVDFGEDVRPRTGGIRIAHYAKADICPVHLMIEEGHRIHKVFRDFRGNAHPFTVFDDTRYFVTFCPPLRYPDYAKDSMSYEDYKKIACAIEDTFVEKQRRIERDLAERADWWRTVPRRGGLARPVSL